MFGTVGEGGGGMPTRANIQCKINTTDNCLRKLIEYRY